MRAKDSGSVTADPLPRCPHGNEAVEREVAPGVTRIDADGPCSCATVTSATRARRAWVALCSAD